MPFKFDDLKAEVKMMALTQPKHHSSHRGRLPFADSAYPAQVTIIALLSLLDFGSGYDDLLLEKNKRDAK